MNTGVPLLGTSSHEAYCRRGQHDSHSGNKAKRHCASNSCTPMIKAIQQDQTNTARCPSVRFRTADMGCMGTGYCTVSAFPADSFQLALIRQQTNSSKLTSFVLSEPRRRRLWGVSHACIVAIIFVCAVVSAYEATSRIGLDLGRPHEGRQSIPVNCAWQSLAIHYCSHCLPSRFRP